jgi:HEAT repeat protein
MEVRQDISNWTRDEKIRHLQSLVDDEAASPDAFPILQTLLHDEDPEVRMLAVTGLWDHPKSEIIDPLLDIVRHDPSQDVRSKAVITLGRFIYEGEGGNLVDDSLAWAGTDEAVPVEQLTKRDFRRVRDALLGLVRDEAQPAETRRFAVETLSLLHTPEVAKIIRQAYEQPDLQMKVSAIFAMGRSGDPAWSDILLQELESPVRELRYEATRAAGEARLTAAGPILMRLAESDDADLKLEALWSLGKTGGPGVHDFLSAAAASDDEDVREIARAALEDFETSDAAGAG